MAYILSLADHCNTLVEYGANAGGNWGFTQNSYMLTFAMNFPEFKESTVWQKTAIERLSAILKEDTLPDGTETESAISYQRMSYNPLARYVYDDLVLDRGLKSPFATEIKSILQKQAEYFMHTAMPDGVSPYLGDWAHEQMRDYILEDARRFDRKDMLYVATAGKKGKKPNELSKLYPSAGIAMMRSDWGDAGRPYEDARYLMLHGVHYGAHGHQDINGIIGLYAYGRELLADPGSGEYGSPEHALLTTAVSHNLMTIDGEEQVSGSSAAFRNWATTPIADYVSSWVDPYNAGDHTREVFYIRANGDPDATDYWVVRDTARGTGTHSLEQRWHFAAESGAKLDPATLEARTAFPDKGNLAIEQVDPSRLQPEQTTTDMWIRRGVGGPPSKLPTVIYKITTPLPAAIDTVLFPFEGAQGPQAVLKVLEKSKDGLDAAFKVVQGHVEDLFVLQSKAGAKELPTEKVSFEGERLFVRRTGGKLRSALLVNGSSLGVDGREIVKSAKPLSWVAVSFEVSGVKAYASAREPTLVVSGRDGKRVTPKPMDTDKLLRLGCDSPAK